jgi:uncharacterized protein YxeA
MGYGVGSKNTSRLESLVAFCSSDLLAFDFWAYNTYGVQKEYTASSDKTAKKKAYLLCIISEKLVFIA